MSRPAFDDINDPFSDAYWERGPGKDRDPQREYLRDSAAEPAAKEARGYRAKRNGGVDAAQPDGAFEGDRGKRFSRNDGTWPEPKPLPDGLLPVATFDPAFLPEVIALWVMDISDRMQCPPDFVGIPAVVTLGSVIGRKVAVRPHRKTDWYETPNLWGCIVGRPGAMKSPAMDEALKPLHRLEAEARKANEAAARDYEIEVETFKLRKEEGQKKGRAALKGGAEDISSLLATDEPEKPKARRYVVNDATYEGSASSCPTTLTGHSLSETNSFLFSKILTGRNKFRRAGFSNGMERDKRLHLRPHHPWQNQY